MTDKMVDVGLSVGKLDRQCRRTTLADSQADVGGRRQRTTLADTRRQSGRRRRECRKTGPTMSAADTR